MLGELDGTCGLDRLPGVIGRVWRVRDSILS